MVHLDVNGVLNMRNVHPLSREMAYHAQMYVCIGEQCKLPRQQLDVARHQVIRPSYREINLNLVSRKVAYASCMLEACMGFVGKPFEVHMHLCLVYCIQRDQIYGKK